MLHGDLGADLRQEDRRTANAESSTVGRVNAADSALIQPIVDADTEAR